MQRMTQVLQPTVDPRPDLCWPVIVLQAFLDERGGDFDDCSTFQQLVS
jgi:hypothetical protein